MAEIRFQILGNNDNTPTIDTLSGSGLAFFGATSGSSVQIGEYQQTTYVANSDASIVKDISSNNKYRTGAFPSGLVTLDATAGSASDLGISGVRSMYGSLGIEFGHTSEVNIQNCQLRVYDRGNVAYPASGVNTKVAEIVNFNGGVTWGSQGTDNGECSDAQGSGDLWWWGESWPSEMCTKNYYTNSVGTVFYNGKDTDTVVNGDSRLSAAAVAGSYDTVGGTGVIVPLLDSPGSGQKQLHNEATLSGSGMVWPKWCQYVTSGKQNEIFGFTFGDGSDTSKSLNTGTLEPIRRTYGGTGIDSHHTWSVALSASPLSTGAKEQYGLYVSLEYY